LELLDFGVLGIVDGFSLAAIVKDEVAVLEEFFLPAVKEGGCDAELVADGGDGYAFEQMPLEGGDLLRWGEMTTFAAHDETSDRVRQTRTERFSRFD
jgi:hypothetical protein